MLIVDGLDVFAGRVFTLTIFFGTHMEIVCVAGGGCPFAVNGIEPNNPTAGLHSVLR